MKNRVLIVDDDDGVRLSIEHILAANEYNIASACNGKQAMLLIDEFKPDLVITDLVMPEQDGMDTIVKVKKLHPEVKIIAMSGGARIGNVNLLQKALELGADHIVAKPFESEPLTDLVQRSLGLRS